MGQNPQTLKQTKQTLIRVFCNIISLRLRIVEYVKKMVLRFSFYFFQNSVMIQKMLKTFDTY